MRRTITLSWPNLDANPRPLPPGLLPNPDGLHHPLHHHARPPPLHGTDPTPLAHAQPAKLRHQAAAPGAPCPDARPKYKYTKLEQARRPPLSLSFTRTLTPGTLKPTEAKSLPETHAGSSRKTSDARGRRHAGELGEFVLFLLGLPSGGSFGVVPVCSPR